MKHFKTFMIGRHLFGFKICRSWDGRWAWKGHLFNWFDTNVVARPSEYGGYSLVRFWYAPYISFVYGCNSKD